MAIPNEVKNAVDLQYNTRQAEIERAIQALRQQMGQGVETQQRYGQGGDAKLQQIYSQLNGQLENVNSRTNEMYGQGSQFIRDAFGQAKSTAEGAYGDIMSQMQGAVGQLGGGQDALAKLQQYIGKSRVGLAGSEANSLANQKQLGNNMGAVSLRAVGDAAQEGAGKRTDLIKAVLANISGIQREGAGNEQELNAKLQDLVREKGEAIRVGTDNYMSLQAQMAAAGSGGGGRGGGGGSRGGSGGGGGSLKDQKDFLDIMLKEKELNRYVGQEGLDRWFREANNGKGASKLTKSAVSNALAKGARHTKNRYSYAMKELQGNPAYVNAGAEQRAAMRRGVDIYYGKYQPKGGAANPGTTQ